MTNLSDDKSKPGLARKLNTGLLVLYGLGVTVGAGIYVLIGEIAGRAGVFSPYAFLFAGLIIAPTTYSFAKLVVRFPVSAGEARYVEEGFRIRPLGIVVGLMVAAAGIVSSATVSAGSIGYLQAFIPLSSPVLLCAVILLFAGVAALGIKESVIVAATVTLVEVAALIALIVAGTISHPDAVLDGLVAPALSFDLTSLALIASAATLAFYAFIGFEDMVNVAEEVKEPEKAFPKAILLTLIVTLVLYFLVATVAVALVGAADLVASPAPIATIAEKTGLLSPSLLSFVGALSALNGILIQMIMSSRVLYGLARQSELPEFLSYVHPTTHTPIVSTLLVAALTLVLALAFPLAGLAEATSRITLAIFVLVNGALFTLTLREANWRIARIENRLLVVVPALGALGSIALMVVSVS